jgi:HD-GYP domain-containing protein (c-di-GMP phosphodiesterase class II)
VSEFDQSLEATAAEAPVDALPAAPRTTLGEELPRAIAIRTQAADVVAAVMSDARFGKAIAGGRVAATVREIGESLRRHPGALLSLGPIKNPDNYSFLRPVSMCALLMAFCDWRGLDQDTVFQAGLGGLLHDIGMALVPDHIVNKRTALTSGEFDLVKRHAADGCALLRATSGIGDVALDIVLRHHERFDGSGYPEALQGTDISELAQMAAIVDVYDALTSDVKYRRVMAPSEAHRELLLASKDQFNESLVHQFIRFLGIYPVGSLVVLESGSLAIVIGTHPVNLLTPRVTVCLDTATNRPVAARTIDLALPGCGDRIQRSTSAAQWGIDADFLATHF